MGALVTYRFEAPVATITMDDGKVNAMSAQMLSEINAALDQAAADRAVVVLTGRGGVFSAGFDLTVLRAGGPEAIAMVRGGFELAERVLSFPTPVTIACTGHAVAMGVFLVLSGDYRIGAAGPHKITANEVAIGLTMPRAAVELCRQRLTPAAFNRAVILAEAFSPDTAVAAGFFDQVVEASAVHDVARDMAVALSKLDLDAHAASKLRARDQTLTAIRAGIEADDAEIATAPQ
jgi:enoyl-CoA hydratase/carnithine racemase